MADQWNGADLMGAIVLMAAHGPSLPTVTWNPSDKGANITLSNGNRTAQQTVNGSYHSVRATHGKSSGLHYFEVRHDQANTANFSLVGVCTLAHSMSSGYHSDDANGFSYYEQTGTKITNGAGSAYGASYTAGDVIGVELNMTAATIEFFKNNVSQGVAFTGLTGTLYAALSLYSNAPNHTRMIGRFRTSDFSYWPRTNPGFSAYGG